MIGRTILFVLVIALFTLAGLAIFDLLAELGDARRGQIIPNQDGVNPAIYGKLERYT